MSPKLFQHQSRAQGDQVHLQSLVLRLRKQLQGPSPLRGLKGTPRCLGQSEKLCLKPGLPRLE